jgi:hypothetical protein
MVWALGGALRRAEHPLVVDLGFGASPVTTLELQQRLRRVVPAAEVVGLEIDPGRVTAARGMYPGGSFELGGFELGGHAGRAQAVRALNVLRQYEQDDVPGAWRRMVAASAPGGTVVEGTCDEVGRLACWVRLDRDVALDVPVSLTVSVRLRDLERPSEVAARLPKALIHQNVPGRPVHGFLAALDAGWAAASPWQAFGVRQRWLHTVAAVRAEGFRVYDGPGRWRLGEITVAWDDVAG